MLRTECRPYLGQPRPPVTQAKLDKRDFVSFVFDGRYKFARYYAPSLFNTPQTLEEIFKDNDVQLFDLESDPKKCTIWRSSAKRTGR